MFQTHALHQQLNFAIHKTTCYFVLKYNAWFYICTILVIPKEISCITLPLLFHAKNSRFDPSLFFTSFPCVWCPSTHLTPKSRRRGENSRTHTRTFPHTWSQKRGRACKIAQCPMHVRVTACLANAWGRNAHSCMH